MKRYQVGSRLLPIVVLAACSSPEGGGGDLTGSGGIDGTGGAVGSGGFALTGGATGSGATSSASGGNASGGAEDCGEPTADSCDFGAGITHVCKRRFALGVNYAWKNFGVDFGGLAAWSQTGVSGNAAIATELRAMADNGVSVVRWWMFPDFRGDGVTFDENGDPSGISAGAVADIQKALELADEDDLYLTLTIFSFDNFKPTVVDGGITIRGITPMITDASRRKKVIDNIVRPIAKTVKESPYANRLFGWDIINEPEWAVSPAGLATNDFAPNNKLTPVTLGEMKTFISEVAAALGEEAPGTKRSVGWAAAKWAPSFVDLANIEFHQPHIYAWVNDYWPYTKTPSELGYGDKPTVMGEFYLASMPLTPSTSESYASIVGSWYDAGFAGAWAWQYNENASDIGLISTFANDRGCVVTY